MYQKILIYGPRKAGTTLLQSLLDGNSELIMIPGELKIKILEKMRGDDFDVFYKLYLEKGRSYFKELDGNNCDDFTFSGLDIDETNSIINICNYYECLNNANVKSFKNYVDILNKDINCFVSSMVNSDSIKQSTKIQVASKEVGGHPEKVISFFKELFPKGKIVYIIRDPKYVVRSIILDRKRKGIQLSLLKVIKECYKAQIIINYVGSIETDEILVDYEKLTIDTEKQMDKLLYKLGLEYEHINSIPTVLGNQTIVKTSSKMTKKVFKQVSDWRQGLTLFQKVCIKLFFLIVPSIYKVMGVKYVNYSELKHYSI